MKKSVIVILLCCLFAGEICAQDKITCPSCNGSGTIVERCTNCRNGVIPCTTCQMAGQIRERCPYCSGGYVSKTVKKTCSYCNGSRYSRESKESPCTSCRNGKRPVTTRGGGIQYVDCSRCGGSGVIVSYYNAACRYCGGTGYSGTETQTERCTNCTNGYVNQTCPNCNGARGTVCPKCNGYANVKTSCNRCRGYGAIYVNN